MTDCLDKLFKVNIGFKFKVRKLLEKELDGKKRVPVEKLDEVI